MATFSAVDLIVVAADVADRREARAQRSGPRSRPGCSGRGAGGRGGSPCSDRWRPEPGAPRRCRRERARGRRSGRAGRSRRRGRARPRAAIADRVVDRRDRVAIDRDRPPLRSLAGLGVEQRARSRGPRSRGDLAPIELAAHLASGRARSRAARLPADAPGRDGRRGPLRASARRPRRACASSARAVSDAACASANARPAWSPWPGTTTPPSSATRTASARSRRGPVERVRIAEERDVAVLEEVAGEHHVGARHLDDDVVVGVAAAEVAQHDLAPADLDARVRREDPVGRVDDDLREVVGEAAAPRPRWSACAPRRSGP